MKQQFIGLIGCPGSGKTTYTNSFINKDWVVCTFDDLRAAMFPPHRRVYWQIRETDKGDAAQKVLHDVQEALIVSALDKGFNVLSADTNIVEKYGSDLTRLASMFDLEVYWKVFDIPWDVLKQRNDNRNEVTCRVPEDILKDRYDQMWAKDAWWRKEKHVEYISYNKQTQ